MALNLSTIICSYPEDFFINWKDDVVSIRQLYRERKYRRCAILCSELLKEAVHPIHKTFLHFYQAICYERLGHIAHNYSSNKIPLLEQARDAFILASEMLPNPDPNSINVKLTVFECTPICATLDIAALYGTPTPSSIYTTRGLSLAEYQDHQAGSTPTPTTERYLTNTYSIPDFEDLPPSKSLHATENIRIATDGETLLTPNQHEPLIHNHKNRLSRSLSSKHALAEELIPSPLFSRGPSSREESRSSSPESVSPTKHRQLTQVALCKPLPPLPPTRPLPHLPFNHNPHFVRKGKRFVVVPRRKTALSTLISKFEGTGPFDEVDSAYTEACGDDLGKVSSQGLRRTPVTERFNKISAVFAEKNGGISNYQSRIWQQQQSSSQNTYVAGKDLDNDEDDTNSDKENIDPTTPKDLAKSYSSNFRLENQKTCPFNPATPCPRPKSRPRDLSPSQDSTSSPESFQATPLPILPQHPPFPNPVHPSTDPTSTYNHLLSTLSPLLKTHIKTMTTTILKTQTLQNQHDLEKRARFARNHTQFSSSPSSPSRKTRMKPLHSFWSLQIVDTDEKAKSNGGNAKDKARDEEKQERIRRLKEQGWNVRKENVGFKGVEYYRELIGMMEREMSMC